MCKECQRAEGKAYYTRTQDARAAYRESHKHEVAAKHREYRRLNPEKAKAEAAHRNAVVRQQLNALKTPCVVCGESDTRVIDFHHLDPSTKLFTLGSKVRGSRALVEAEAAKCACLCANCHRRFHAGDEQTVVALHEILGGELLAAGRRY